MATFWSTIGLLGAVIGGAIGAVLGRWLDGERTGDPVDEQTVKRTAIWVAIVLLVAVPCTIAGWFVGAWAGDVATRGCQEMDCLTGLLGPIGGVFIGGLIGGTVGAVLARQFHSSKNRPQA